MGAGAWRRGSWCPAAAVGQQWGQLLWGCASRRGMAGVALTGQPSRQDAGAAEAGASMAGAGCQLQHQQPRRSVGSSEPWAVWWRGVCHEPYCNWLYIVQQQLLTCAAAARSSSRYTLTWCTPYDRLQHSPAAACLCPGAGGTWLRGHAMAGQESAVPQ